MTEFTERPVDEWVVIAAFNEARVIASVICGLSPFFQDIVVVDDGSSDDTAKVAGSAGAVVLRHPVNLGQGAALQTAIDFALSKGAGYIVTFDADGQHDPGDARTLLDRLKECRVDVALGSRFMGKTTGITRSRRTLLSVAKAIQRFSTGLNLTDAHNGLRAFTRDAAWAIRIRQNRMAHASEIIAQIARRRLSYIEVPCHITYTEYSKGKGQRFGAAFQIAMDLIVLRLYR